MEQLNRFRLLAGMHIQRCPKTGERQTFNAGAIVLSKRDLVADHGTEKFIRLSPARAGAVQTGPAEAEPGDDVPEDDETIPYENMTVAQLRALCEEREIDVPADARKADLIKVLRG